VTRTIVPGQVKLDIYKPDNEPDDPANPEADRTPDIQVGPATDTAHLIDKASVPRSLGALKDQASFALANRAGRYSRGASEITSGDEVVFSVEFADNPGTWSERFRGVVRNPKVSGDGAGESTFSFKCEEFVGGILGWRYLEAGYKNRRVAGTESSVLESALAEKCPEIARDRITADGRETTQTFNATKMLKVVRGLANILDSTVSTDARSLVVEPLSGVSASWSLEAGDYGTFEAETDDGELANAIRIDGPTSQGTQDKQETQTGWANVTDDSRITRQLDVPKSEISRIGIWTDPTRTNSGDDIRVRIQKDDGGAPLDPTDSSLDEAFRTNNGILEHDGWTTFPLPDNKVLDPDPWLIIEATTDGDGSGQDIGVNNAGVPTYRAYYPFPISGRKKDADSIDEYRRRERQLSDTSLTSLNRLSQELNAQLNHENTLSNTFGFDARSLRAHQLTPGDAIWIDEPTAGLAGEFMVTKRQGTYSGGLLRTDVTTAGIEDVPSDPTGWGAAWGETWGS